METLLRRVFPGRTIESAQSQHLAKHTSDSPKAEMDVDVLPVDMDADGWVVLGAAPSPTEAVKRRTYADVVAGRT